MYPLNDNDLDRLSREAADQYDVEPSTSGWEALEHRLNKELPLKEDKERRHFLFWLFFVVILAGGGLLWTMTGREHPSGVQLTGTNKTGGRPGAAGQSTSPEKSSHAIGEPRGTDEPSGAAGQPMVPREPSGAASLPVHPSRRPSIAGDRSVSMSSADRNTQQDMPAGGQAHQASAGNTGQRGPAVPRTGKGMQQPALRPLTAVTANETDPVDHAGFASMGHRDARASLVAAPNLQAGKRGAIKAPPLTLAVENKEAPASPERLRQPKGWELGLLAGPDMSNVRFTDADKVGYNVGLQVAYRFSDHWSMNTGGIYTRKHYTAQGKDFTKPNTNYWNQADVKKVAGYCSMFDIPLNVRYDFPHNRKTRWFVSAGASTYIMTSEYYTINYLYNGLPRVHPYESDSATQVYPFAVINFSAGFERKLNKRLSLQAEPYFKLPTRGLGYGKLDLSSYGLYFSLRYQLHP